MTIKAESTSVSDHCLGECEQHTRSAQNRLALTLAIAGALHCMYPATTKAQLFPAEIELGSLDGSNGFAIVGESTGDFSGISVGGAGDLNGDGLDDLVVGAIYSDPSGVSNAGRSYVVFGASNGFPPALGLFGLDGQAGIKINGEAENDFLGRSVHGAGDINGDGSDDLIVGAIGSDVNGDFSGRSYVVYGDSNGLPASLDLASLNGLNGFALNGAVAGEYSGGAVSSAGDFNGDGIDDLAIGAFRADVNAVPGAGRVYVVYGSDSQLPNPVQLSDLNGLNGFILNGDGEETRFGDAISAAGDVNGDGIDDLILGDYYADVGGRTRAGRAYVIFGSDQGLPNPFDIATLDGSNGFVINGDATEDYAGISVDAAGDVNADGIDDLIVGALGASSLTHVDAGRSYVIFGSTQGLPHPFDLGDVNGLNGLILEGGSVAELAGASVSGLGDINGDGIDDLAIGAPIADPDGREDAGLAYVVFGSESPLPSPLDLSNLNGSNGFAMSGRAAGDRFGGSVSNGGDVNGDGINDLIVGARGVGTMFVPDNGTSYVIFGRGDRLFEDRFQSD